MGLSPWYGVEYSPDDPRILTLQTPAHSSGLPGCRSYAVPVVVANTPSKVEIAMARYASATLNETECPLIHLPDLKVQVTLDKPVGARALVDAARH